MTGRPRPRPRQSSLQGSNGPDVPLLPPASEPTARVSIAVGLAVLGVAAGVGRAGRAVYARPSRSLVRRTGRASRRRLRVRPRPPPNDRPGDGSDRRPGPDHGFGAAGVRPGGRLHTQASGPIDVGRPRTRRRWRDGGAARPGPGWLVLSGGRTRCTRAGRHRRARHVGRRTCGLSPPGRTAAWRSRERHPRGREDCRLHRQPGGQILEVAVPQPGGLRRHRPCWTATDHLWWHVRRRQTSYLDNVVVFARLEAVREPRG